MGPSYIRRPYDLLLSMPGVGRVLALTIMMETGPIERFPKVGNYVSYCRKVLAARYSNEKKKETGNRKNGNKYLSWAYAEAAELARRFDPKQGPITNGSAGAQTHRLLTMRSQTRCRGWPIIF
jgi:transposase